MTKIEHTEVTELYMTALPGSKLGDCMREAVLMACKFRRRDSNASKEENPND